MRRRWLPTAGNAPYRADGLLASFAALYRYFECPRVAVRAVVVLLAIHTGLLAYSAYVHSPTLNEPAHLVAGLSHWKFGRFELYRVNPPLVRMVAALPVIAVGYNEDWSGFYEAPGARPVFQMGTDFIQANGERSYWIFTIARWACIPFCWLGAITCYLWARDLFGFSSGVIACALWSFSPNVLGHGALIAPDMHATSLGVAACYTFWRWLKQPSWIQAVITGCVLGLAELAKSTLILFYPLWPLLWIAYRWPERKEMSGHDWSREAVMLLLRMAIGLYILNLGYGFEEPLKPLKDFHFVSDLFTGSVKTEDNSGREDFVAPSSNTESINRFAGTILGELPVPFPKNYLIGIDVQQKDFENFGRPSYLCGRFQDRGWWYYYLYAVAVKVPLGAWLLAFLTIAMRSIRRRHDIRWKESLMLLAPPLVIFVVVSSKTGFSHHMRYVFPCFPFAFIWISQVVAVFATTKAVMPRQRAHALRRSFMLGGAAAFVWAIVSGVVVYPHSISYFNELAGGPAGGRRHLINSNLDWGQDLLLLKWWREEHAESLQAIPFYLAYYGESDPADLGFADALPWPDRKDAASDSDVHSSVSELKAIGLTTGYYAISANFLQGYTWPARDGERRGKKLLQQSMVAQLRSKEPCGRAGYSMSIFLVE